MRYEKQAQTIAATVRPGGKRRVVAAGGMGKTYLLERIAVALGDVQVTRWSPALDPDGIPDVDGVLLADDVHLASPDVLRAIARREGGVVAAQRPAERAAEELLGALIGAPLVLGPLRTDDMRVLLASLWDAEPEPAIIDEMLTATGGVPRLVVAVAGSEAVTRVRRTATLEELVRSERQRLGATERAVLDAAAVLAGLDLSLLAAASNLEIDQVADAAARLASAGLALDGGRLAPIVAAVVRPRVPGSELAALVERAAAAALATGHDITTVADAVSATGVTGPATAQCLLLAARQVIDVAPERARAWVDAAARGGAVAGDLAAMQALISFRQGRVEHTVAAVDDLFRADPDWRIGSLRREAVETAAIVLARRGAWVRSAELAEAVGPDGDNAVALAATARLAVGDASGVRNVVKAYDKAPPPGLRSAAASALARGLATSLDEDPAPALPLLLDAARLYELSAPAVPLPESPHALAAVVACHLWEFDVAAQILADIPPQRVAARSYRPDLLRAWVAMRRGDWVGALAGVDHVRSRTAALDARDALLARAVEAGVARRRGDLEAMERAWRQSRTLLLRQVPDMLLLQPVGELLITGARLGDRGTVRTCMASVRQIVARGDHPPLWALSMLWDELHIATALSDGDAARSAAKAADALPGLSGRAGAVASAALCWVDALAGDADPTRVRSVASDLADAGLTWEAAKLAGAAAIRISDSAQMRNLLQFARSLNAERTPLLSKTANDLSAREREVASHLLAGLTYREIGAQLYIAPKTVEHHVARIRRKLGAQSRAELLLALRQQISVAGTA